MKPDGDECPHCWSRSSTVPIHQRRRRPPHPIINPVALILLIPIVALLVIFFLLPPFLSHTQNLLRPNSVKKSWDSLNVLLVIFAIICGVFARRKDDVSAAVERDVSPAPYSRRRVHDTSRTGVPETGRLLRTSSYPDLRQVPATETDENRYRFYDDFEVNRYGSKAAEFDRHRPRRSEMETEANDIKVIPEDTDGIRNPPPPLASPSTPAPPPLPQQPSSSRTKLNRRRSLHSVPRKENVERQSNVRASEFVDWRSPPPPSAPPPPPPPATAHSSLRSMEDTPKLQRKKSGTKKEITTAIASLYNQTKRKRRTKPRSESTSDHSPPSDSPLQPQTPPPPPPPPPSKGFQNPFKKSSKSKRVHSDSPMAVPSQPPVPPPLPPNSIFNNFFKTSSTSKRCNQSPLTTPPPPPPPPPHSSLMKNGNQSRRAKPVSRTSATPPPPPPRPPPSNSSSSRKKPSVAVKTPMSDTTTMNHTDDNLNSGGQSPLIPMPPPPPPPPFRMREMKFVARGDFVRIRSGHSSWCSSPEIEDCDLMSMKSEQTDGEDVIGPAVYCPSPDVNSKAESFIARLRDEWRLEKMNSLREHRKLG